MKVKTPYGTTAQNNALTLPAGFLTIDTEKHAIRFHDGVTQGGFEVIGTKAYTPPFGEAWDLLTLVNAATTINPSGIAHGNSMWVAPVGTTSSVNTSTDGTIFTDVTGFTLTFPYDIIFANGFFYMSCTTGSGNVNLVKFADPASTKSTLNIVSWATSGGGIAEMCIGGASNEYMGVVGFANSGGAGGFGSLFGKVTLSNSALSIQNTTGDNGTCIAYGGGKLVAGGFVQTGQTTGWLQISSNDGTSWSRKTAGIPNRVDTIAYGTDTYWAISGNNSGGNVYFSPDLGTFTASATGLTSIIDIAYFNGKWVVLSGDGKIAFSADRSTWTIKSVLTFTTGAKLRVVNGLLFVVGLNATKTAIARMK